MQKILTFEGLEKEQVVQDADGIHPNTTGAAEIATNVTPVIGY